VDITIRALAELIATVTGFTGEIVFDATKPDGTPRKLLDVTRLAALGWRAPTGLREGLSARTAGTCRSNVTKRGCCVTVVSVAWRHGF